MAGRKLAAALGAGCTVVMKAPAETPYSMLAMVELCEQAGIPKGVVNVVTTDKNTKDIGKELCENKKLKKITFTGSTPVGKILMQQSASTLKKLSFELGGNAPFIGESLVVLTESNFPFLFDLVLLIMLYLVTPTSLRGR